MTIENYRRIRILNSAYEEVMNLDGDTGNVTVGGRNVGGDIGLYVTGDMNTDDLLNAVIHLDAGNDRISIRNNSNRKDTIVMDAGDGNLLLGGNGRDGDIICFKSESTNASYSDALASYRQRATIHFDGQQANLWMGGNNTDGDIVLFAGNATDINDLSQATIHLDGQTGDINLQNADCAEEFDIFDENIEPGTVMVIDSNVKLTPCNNSYDKKVAGVVSGAGKYKSGIILDKQLKNCKRIPIALLGKVYCKVDASYSAIEQGDLLTSSDTLGHAMKAVDRSKSFGTIIGKALKSLRSGQGLIPILVSLQ